MRGDRDRGVGAQQLRDHVLILLRAGAAVHHQACRSSSWPPARRAVGARAVLRRAPVHTHAVPGSHRPVCRSAGGIGGWISPGSIVNAAAAIAIGVAKAELV